METLFADAFYWVALINPSDEYHAVVYQFNEKNHSLLVTSEEVLTELLNNFSRSGPFRRRQVSEMVNLIIEDPSIITVRQSTESFNSGLQLYQKREDKGYSLTDCISMNIMRERGITRVLTHDDHFRQEGFFVMF